MACALCPCPPQESKKDSSLQVASQKTLEYGQVVFSTDNIFNRCHSRSTIGYPAGVHPLPFDTSACCVQACSRVVAVRRLLLPCPLRAPAPDCFPRPLPCAESNPLQQLDVVGNFVSDLGAIIKAHKLEQARANRAEESHEQVRESCRVAGPSCNCLGYRATNQLPVLTHALCLCPQGGARAGGTGAAAALALQRERAAHAAHTEAKDAGAATGS